VLGGIFQDQRGLSRDVSPRIRLCEVPLRYLE